MLQDTCATRHLRNGTLAQRDICETRHLRNEIFAKRDTCHITQMSRYAVVGLCKCLATNNFFTNDKSEIVLRRV
jgi:hypothetical protein